MANTCRSMKTSILIDIKLEDNSETEDFELRKEESRQKEGSRNTCENSEEMNQGINEIKQRCLGVMK